MNMSIFEIIMLLCFGAAWPVSIYKSYTSRRNTGKSLFFLYIIIVGYIAGILHKLVFSYNAVIFLYILNLVMVTTDIFLYYRNKGLEKKESSGGM